MEPQVRATVLTNYPDVARAVGLVPEQMLENADLDARTIRDPEQMISAVAAARLFEATAGLAGGANIGLLLAESRSLDSVGPISLALRHQPTARDAVGVIMRYQRLIAPAVAMRFDEGAAEGTVAFDLLLDMPAPQGVEFSIGLMCRVLVAATGGRWRPSAVHFVHARPDDTRVHQRVFECPVVFLAAFNGLTCGRDALDAQIAGADPLMARHARRYLDILMAQTAEGSVASQVTRALHLLLPAGKASLDQVVQELRTSPRRLQRALGEDDATFQDVLTSVRRNLAQRYLADQTQSVTDIAWLTGYANLSSFTRWFTREFGMSPAAWRARSGQRAGVSFSNRPWEPRVPSSST